MVALTAAYGVAFGFNAYGTFHDAEDLGDYAYNMNYYSNYGVPTALQYLVFGNHMAPDQVALLLVYASLPSPLTLIVVQSLVLSLGGLASFFAARRALGSASLSLLFCFAFLANPGMHGILFFDYHAEFLILPL